MTSHSHMNILLQVTKLTNCQDVFDVFEMDKLLDGCLSDLVAALVHRLLNEMVNLIAQVKKVLIAVS